VSSSKVRANETSRDPLQLHFICYPICAVALSFLWQEGNREGDDIGNCLR
jgi:hypothetical protein